VGDDRAAPIALGANDGGLVSAGKNGTLLGRRLISRSRPVPRPRAALATRGAAADRCRAPTPPHGCPLQERCHRQPRPATRRHRPLLKASGHSESSPAFGRNLERPVCQLFWSGEVVVELDPWLDERGLEARKRQEQVVCRKCDGKCWATAPTTRLSRWSRSGLLCSTQLAVVGLMLRAKLEERYG
jgi:hypothetical protein